MIKYYCKHLRPFLVYQFEELHYTTFNLGKNDTISAGYDGIGNFIKPWMPYEDTWAGFEITEEEFVDIHLEYNLQSYTSREAIADLIMFIKRYAIPNIYEKKDITLYAGKEKYVYKGRQLVIINKE